MHGKHFANKNQAKNIIRDQATLAAIIWKSFMFCVGLSPIILDVNILSFASVWHTLSVHLCRTFLSLYDYVSIFHVVFCVIWLGEK